MVWDDVIVSDKKFSIFSTLFISKFSLQDEHQQCQANAEGETGPLCAKDGNRNVLGVGRFCTNHYHALNASYEEYKYISSYWQKTRREGFSRALICAHETVLRWRHQRTFNLNSEAADRAAADRAAREAAGRAH